MLLGRIPDETKNAGDFQLKKRFEPRQCSGGAERPTARAFEGTPRPERTTAQIRERWQRDTPVKRLRNHLEAVICSGYANSSQCLTSFGTWTFARSSATCMSTWPAGETRNAQQENAAPLSKIYGHVSTARRRAESRSADLRSSHGRHIVQRVDHAAHSAQDPERGLLR